MPLTGPLTAWGRLSCTQMCPLRGKLGAASPHFPTGFRVGPSQIDGTSWTQMWAATGRIAGNRSCGPFGELRGSLLGKPRPDARDPATCAGLTCANPAALGHDRESQARGGGSLSLFRDMRATMIACTHIDTRTAPGLARAHGPPNCTRPHRNKRPGGGFTICPAVSRRTCQAVEIPSRSVMTSS